MKKYTQADVDAIARSWDGYKYLPQGEYASNIQFGSMCVLGDGCTLGYECTLGDGCTLEDGKIDLKRYLKIGPVGSRNDHTYFYFDVDGEIYVRVGCYFGGVEDFVERVKQVHAGTPHEREYLAAVDFAKVVLRGEP